MSLPLDAVTEILNRPWTPDELPAQNALDISANANIQDPVAVCDAWIQKIEEERNRKIRQIHGSRLRPATLPKDIFRSSRRALATLADEYPLSTTPPAGAESVDEPLDAVLWRAV